MSAAARHPLEPLDAAEMRQVAAVLRAGGRLREGVKVIGVTLHEPTREDLRALAAGRTLDREAFAVLLDSASGETEEAVVSLTTGRVASSRRLTGVQPPIVSGDATPPSRRCARTRRGRRPCAGVASPTFACA